MERQGNSNSYNPANTSTLIFGWKWKLSRRTFIDVASTQVKQHWNNVNRIMLIQCRWTNVVSTLKFGWKWNLIWRMFIDFVSTLTKHRWNSIERITSIQCWWLNIVSTLIFGWVNVSSSALLWHWQNSIDTTLSIFVVLRFTRKWLNNKAKLYF